MLPLRSLVQMTSLSRVQLVAVTLRSTPWMPISLQSTADDLTVTASANMVATGAVVDNDVSIIADDIDIGAGLNYGDFRGLQPMVASLLLSSGNDVDTLAQLISTASLTVTSADQFTTAGALNAENDISVTADDYVATTTTNTQAGALTISVTNDIDLNGAVTVVGGGATITQTATTGSVNLTGGNLTVDNDTTVSGENVTLAAATTVAGNLTVTGQNDVDLNGAVDASGNLVVTATLLTSMPQVWLSLRIMTSPSRVAIRR